VLGLVLDDVGGHGAAAVAQAVAAAGLALEHVVLLVRAPVELDDRAVRVDQGSGGRGRGGVALRYGNGSGGRGTDRRHSAVVVFEHYGGRGLSILAGGGDIVVMWLLLLLGVDRVHSVGVGVRVQDGGRTNSCDHIVFCLYIFENTYLVRFIKDVFECNICINQ